MSSSPRAAATGCSRRSRRAPIDVVGGDRPRHEVDRDLGAGLVLEQLPEQLDVLLVDLRGEQPCLPELPRKMSANRDEMTTRKP